MEDYLSDNEKWDLVKRSVRENAPLVVGVAVLMAAAIFGWRAWQSHHDQVAGDASAKYGQMTQALDSGNSTQALVLLGELERDHAGSPYLDQAKLAAAGYYVNSNQLDKAAKELQDVTRETQDSNLALVARLRLARVQLGEQKPDEALATLNAVKDLGAFAPRYHEVRGDAFFAKGDKTGALDEYKAARSADRDNGLANSSVLDLKISDLVADAAPGAGAAANPAAPVAAPTARPEAPK